VIKSTGIMNARFTGHGRRIALTYHLAILTPLETETVSGEMSPINNVEATTSGGTNTGLSLES
jgi:hypothetical protein